MYIRVQVCTLNKLLLKEKMDIKSHTNTRTDPIALGKQESYARLAKFIAAT